MFKHIRPLLAAAALLLAAGASQAQSYSFSCVTHNYDTACAGGEAQLGMSVTSANGAVNLRLTNTGAAAMSITDVYFDWLTDAYAMAQGVITASTGVSYDWGASPANLPGGGSFSANLGADSNSPVQQNGVNPGEWVNFAFQGSLSTFVSGLNSNLLRVGIHVQGFNVVGGDSVSESFVSVPTTVVTAPVPEPGTYALMLAGLAAIGMTLRRRQSRR